MKIKINDHSFELKYTVNSLCDVEERAGMPIDQMMDRQFTATRLLLWGGLIEAQSELSIQDVGTMLNEHIANGGTLEDIVDMCADGLREAGFLSNLAENVRNAH